VQIQYSRFFIAFFVFSIKQVWTPSSSSPLSSTSSSPLLLAYHTNRPLTNETPPAGLRLLSGWWADGVSAAHVQQLQQRHRAKIRKPWNLLQVFKYEWLLDATASARDDEPWLLMDTDTLVQCDAGHLRRRFEAMATPLLIGTEKQQRGVHAPLALEKGAKDGAAYWATGALPVYQNSGMLMGTRAGLRRLVSTMRSFDRFPCCPRLHVDGSLSKKECRVDDQVCLFAALASPGMRAPSADGAASRPAFELDVNATLFASLAWQVCATAPAPSSAPHPAGALQPPSPARVATRAPRPRWKPFARTHRTRSLSTSSLPVARPRAATCSRTRSPSRRAASRDRVRSTSRASQESGWSPNCALGCPTSLQARGSGNRRDQRGTSSPVTLDERSCYHVLSRKRTVRISWLNRIPVYQSEPKGSQRLALTPRPHHLHRRDRA